MPAPDVVGIESQSGAVVPPADGTIGHVLPPSAVGYRIARIGPGGMEQPAIRRRPRKSDHVGDTWGGACPPNDERPGRQRRLNGWKVANMERGWSFDHPRSVRSLSWRGRLALEQERLRILDELLDL